MPRKCHRRTQGGKVGSTQTNKPESSLGCTIHLLHTSPKHLFQERIQNQIQLAYNLTAAGLAEATRKDSQAMIAIAFITLVFLPPTFISTVFSTSFFDFGDGGIVSRKFWVYWVVTVPITVFVNYLWYRYIISGPKEMRRQHMERLKAKLPWSTEDIAQVIP